MKAITIRLSLVLFVAFLVFSGCSKEENPDPECTVGASCDDGDALTENDVFDASCNCAGIPICTVGAACDDGDPITENDIYDASCDCAGTPICTVGAACDDGDPITENDVYDASCDCAGTPICSVGAACDDGDPITENDIYDASCDCAGTPICSVGAACDDGDPITENDIYDASCDCAGTPICTVGAACDDGIASTENDVYNEICECIGTPIVYTFTDPRDGQTYPYVVIGSQEWMAENLNYSTGNSPCYDDDSANCNTYGFLYDWQTANNVCPAGWHLPSDAEWTQLIDFLGGETVAGGKMKEVGLAHWISPNTGATNSSGFTGLPGGYRGAGGSFKVLGENGNWWSASELNVSIGWHRFMSFANTSVIRDDGPKIYGRSVRCVKD